MNLLDGKNLWKIIPTVFKELLRGKSLARILLNVNLLDIELFGSVLDLGSKSSAASYNRFLRRQEHCQMTYTDLYEEGDGIIKLNLEDSFAVENDKYDFITCFNVLEHIYDYKNVVKESYRILKPNGFFIGSTPFLINYHADPHDYFRYTHEAIDKIFFESGFVVDKMIFLGYGPMLAAFETQIHLYPKILRPLFTFCILVFDWFILKLKKSQRLRYPLGYLYIMRKK